MKTLEGWQAKGNIFVPQGIIDKSRDDKSALMKDFKSNFDSILNENSHRREPYFILFKAKFDDFNPNVCRQVFTVYEDRPPYIVRSLVFWVDNTRGLVLRIWEVDRDKKIHFNIAAAMKLKGILRSSVSN